MTVYVVATINIHDRARYEQYASGFMAIFTQHSGRMLAVDDAPETVEGEWPWTRTVLIEFPSRAAVRAWYDSPEYQALAAHRFAASVANVALLTGLP